MAQRGTHAVHRRIAAAEHHDVQPFGVDVRLFRQLQQPHHLFGVSDQERQRVIYAGRVFIRQIRFHRAIGSGANKYRVIVIKQRRQRDIFAYLAVQLKAHAHLGKDFPPPGQQRFIQLKGRNTKGQQAADFRMAVKDHRTHAIAHQPVGAGKPGRTRADNRHPLAAFNDLRKIRPPAVGQRLVGDIAFNIADGHRTMLIAQRAGPFAQAILRADAAGNFRQAVSLVRELNGGGDIPFFYALDPLGDVVMQRAGPFTNAVLAALQAAFRLAVGLTSAEWQINFVKVRLTGLGG